MSEKEKDILVDRIAYELHLYPYQIELLKRILKFDGEIVFYIPSRCNGKIMMNKAYNEIIKSINKEE